MLAHALVLGLMTTLFLAQGYLSLQWVWGPDGASCVCLLHPPFEAVSLPERGRFQGSPSRLLASRPRSRAAVPSSLALPWAQSRASGWSAVTSGDICSPGSLSSSS